MASITLYIGNHNYSSWSLRPWILLRHLGIDFDEVLIPLDQPETRARILAVNPAGKLPLLRHGALDVWESLAICEYACELAGAGLPHDAAARAVARSMAATDASQSWKRTGTAPSCHGSSRRLQRSVP